MQYFKVSNLFLCFCVVLLFAACEKEVDPELAVVAQIGNETITVRDFRRSYEFGFAHLKTGEDRKATYLDYMIKEKVLALDGYKRGLDKNERVQNLENDLLNELLIEQLFISEVNSKINITPDQIKESINKSKVKWKLRYWVEPTREYADRVVKAMRARGYADVVDEILGSNPETSLTPKDFETGYLSFLDVTDEFLATIKDLPIGGISDPVEQDGVFFIYQIADVQRTPVTENDYADQYEKYRQILYYRALEKEAVNYVSTFMRPKNVTTKGDPFRLLAEALTEWQNGDLSHMDFSDAVEQASEKSAMKAVSKRLKETLVTFNNDKWTMGDFLERFDPKTLKIDSKETYEIRKQLNEQIALNVRDELLGKEARRKGLHKSADLKREMHEWRDKWVYKEARRFYSKNVTVDDEMTASFFEKYKDRYKIRHDDEPTLEKFKNQVKRDAAIQWTKVQLNQKVDSLKAFTPVTINHAVLDTIHVVEFEKSRWATMQVYKNSSKRLAAPIVDPAWGF